MKRTETSFIQYNRKEGSGPSGTHSPTNGVVNDDLIENGLRLTIRFIGRSLL